MNVFLLHQVGDLIETYLVQIRDIDKVMKSAKTGSVKERRNAAFELASLAATGDDTKFRIVQEGGYAIIGPAIIGPSDHCDFPHDSNNLYSNWLFPCHSKVRPINLISFKIYIFYDW